MFFAKDYPQEILQLLLQGSVGPLQLGTLAEKALSMSQKYSRTEAESLFTMAGQMLLASWESDILNPHAARDVVRMYSLKPCCPVQMISLAKLIAKMGVSEHMLEYQNLLQTEDASFIQRYIQTKHRQEPQSLFWIYSAVHLAYAAEHYVWLEQLLVSSAALLQPLQQGILGDVSFIQGNFEKAQKHYTEALRTVPSLTWRERLGDALLSSGQRDQALHHWDAVLTQRPWHVSLWLKRYDVIHEYDKAGNLPEGQGAVLLYTWNKAACLDASLQSIATSNLGTARVVVFDNGSTDTTRQVISAWEDKLGSRMSSFRAPCNIGAPAARNWLLTMPQTQDCAWVAYLDDDATVPPDWLGHFGTAMQAYPQHPVYGCRVVNHDNAHIIQNADLHLRQGNVQGSMRGGEEGSEPGHVQRFTLSELHLEGLDFASFAYMRPCASVTGCCHLFRRKALDVAGDFDLRFSPSQYDDLEHDIRLALQGQWPIYQGHLAVKHMRKSGKETSCNEASSMSAWSNLFKLQTKYTHEEYEILRQKEHAILLNDLLLKVEGE